MLSSSNGMYLYCTPFPRPLSYPGHTQDQDQQFQSHLDSAHVAQKNVVSLSLKDGCLPSMHSSPSTTFPVSGWEPNPPSKSGKTPPEDMATPWFQDSEMTCSEDVRDILLNSRSSTTQHTYLHKCKRFHTWCQNRQIMATSSPLSMVLDYILELKKSGLSKSSVKVHLASVMAFHNKVDEFLIFTHPTTKHFLKGIHNPYPKL